MSEQAYELHLVQIPLGRRAVRRKLIHDGPLPEGFGPFTQLTLEGKQWQVDKVKPTKIYMRLDSRTLRPIKGGAR